MQLLVFYNYVCTYHSVKSFVNDNKYYTMKLINDYLVNGNTRAVDHFVRDNIKQIIVSAQRVLTYRNSEYQERQTHNHT